MLIPDIYISEHPIPAIHSFCVISPRASLPSSHLKQTLQTAATRRRSEQSLQTARSSPIVLVISMGPRTVVLLGAVIATLRTICARLLRLVVVAHRRGRLVVASLGSVASGGVAVLVVPVMGCLRGLRARVGWGIVLFVIGHYGTCE